MEEFSGSMVSAARSTLERWQSHDGAGQELDIAREMVGLTINILGRTLFRLDFSPLAGPLSEDLNVLTGWAMSRMTSLLGLPLSVPTPRNRRAQKALGRLDSMVSKMFRQHEQASGEGNDLLTAPSRRSCDETAQTHLKYAPSRAPRAFAQDGRSKIQAKPGTSLAGRQLIP